MPKNHIKIWIHVVWITKFRAPLLDRRWRLSLFQHIKKIGKTKGYHIDHVNGIEDHVHALVKMTTSQNIATIVRDIKGTSAHWINEQKLLEHDKSFKWQRGYAAITVSPDRVNVVRNYIRKQEIHHGRIPLQQELDQYFDFSDEE